MKKLIYDIINKLNRQDIQFGDVRFTSTDNQVIFFEKKSLKHISTTTDAEALGIRVLVDGCWGFAGTDVVDVTKVDTLINLAISNAKHSARFKHTPVKFKAIKPTVGSYHFRPEEDPFLMSNEEKIEYFQDIANKLNTNPKIIHSYVHANFYRQYKIYANTEGTTVDSIVYDTMPSISVFAADDKGMQQRTWPGHMSTRRGGFEVVRAAKLEENIEKIVKEVIELLDAPTIQEEKADLIIGGGHLALQIHESIGHATEADRILGMEISYAGKTFVKPEMLGNFKYGSEHVNIYSDSTDPRGIGYHPVDDEGIPGKKVDIIKNGILVNQQTSREVAQELGLEPSSNMKGSFANEFPLVRMTNFCLEPGVGTLSELIKETEKGYLIDFTKTWSIDDNRNNFQFTTEIGWKIQDGQITGIVKEPTYYGITSEFWNSCDRVCGEEEWDYFSTFNCGKGEPGQAMHLSHGLA